MNGAPILRPSEARKLSLLRTLNRMNDIQLYPRMAELVRSDDGRAKIPQNTIIARRRTIRALIGRGYIEWVNDKAGHPVLLAISKQGIDALSRLDR